MPAEPFPSVYWPTWDADATFVAGETLPPDAESAAWAVLVFVFYGDRVVLADIEKRGLCIPSGHVEAGETFEAAAIREVWEEVGVPLTPDRLKFVGWYALTPRRGAREGAARLSPVYIADALGFEAIPAGSESRGVTLAAVEDVADLYFMWDPLLAAVFAYADERRQALLPAGTPLSELWQDTP